MKKQTLRSILTVYIFLCIQLPSTNAQTNENPEKLVRVLKTMVFPISRSAPKYIMEIKNDTTISFYNSLPYNLTQHQIDLIKSHIVDSTTIMLEAEDYLILEKTILRMDMESVSIPKRKQPEGNIVAFKSGVTFPQYFIETSGHSSGFTAYYDDYEEPSDSAKIIIKLIDELEKKYKH